MSNIDTYNQLKVLTEKLANEFPMLNVSFGYIGNIDDRTGVDDRVWGVFSTHPNHKESVMFGRFPTDKIGLLVEWFNSGAIRIWLQNQLGLGREPM